METHEMVGRKVRSAIEEISGTMPENSPPCRTHQKSQTTAEEL